jgi:hypothetical protein
MLNTWMAVVPELATVINETLSHHDMTLAPIALSPPFFHQKDRVFNRIAEAERLRREAGDDLPALLHVSRQLNALNMGPGQ